MVPRLERELSVGATIETGTPGWPAAPFHIVEIVRDQMHGIDVNELSRALDLFEDREDISPEAELIRQKIGPRVLRGRDRLDQQLGLFSEHPQKVTPEYIEKVWSAYADVIRTVARDLMDEAHATKHASALREALISPQARTEEYVEKISPTIGLKRTRKADILHAPREVFRAIPDPREWMANFYRTLALSLTINLLSSEDLDLLKPGPIPRALSSLPRQNSTRLHAAIGMQFINPLATDMPLEMQQRLPARLSESAPIPYEGRGIFQIIGAHQYAALHRCTTHYDIFERLDMNSCPCIYWAQPDGISVGSSTGNESPSTGFAFGPRLRPIGPLLY